MSAIWRKFPTKIDVMAARPGWLSSQPEDFRDRVIDLSTIDRFGRGQEICGFGDAPGSLFGLISGSLSVFACHSLSGPTLVHIASPGFWAGDPTLLSNTPRRLALVARQDCLIATLSRRAIRQLCAHDPESWRRIGHAVVGHIDDAMDHILSLRLGRPELRVLSTLCRLITFDDTRRHCFGSIDATQTEIAELAGMSRNAVVTVLRDLESHGLVQRRYRKLVVPDARQLQQRFRDLSASCERSAP